MWFIKEICIKAESRDTQEKTMYASKYVYKLSLYTDINSNYI